VAVVVVLNIQTLAVVVELAVCALLLLQLVVVVR
jgi:hypothetical protein